MLDTVTKKRIDDCRDILVGKLPDPKAQIEQITIALIYKFMDDMDKEAIELGGKAKFFADYKIPDPKNSKKTIVIEFKKYGWDSLINPKVSAAEMLKLYSEAIELMSKNPNIPQLFRDIFNNAYLPYRSPETLKMFLKTISEFEYTHSEKLGDAFEYLLSVMGSQGDAGQFRTPRHIIDFLVKIVDPGKNDTILDPACGTAGFLISAYKHIKETSKKGLTPDERKKLMKNVVGYDISPDMVRLSRVNLYLHGFSEPHIYEYDTLSSEDRWKESYDMILANPPFMSPKGGIMPHKKFSISSSRSEVLFVDYIAEHLTPKGRAGIIVPEGIIFQSGRAYKALRKMLVENYLYAVVSLPAGVFNPYSGVKTSILLMDRELAKNCKEILFVKIENDGYGLGAQRNEVKGGQLDDAVEVIANYRTCVEGGKKFKNLEIAHAIKKAEISKSGDYNLSGERYKTAVRNNSAHKVVSFSDKDLFQVVSGGTPDSENTEFWNGEINWATLADLPASDTISTIVETKRKITEAGLKNSSAKLLPVNSILVSTRATIGRIAMNKVACCTNQGFKNVIIKDEGQVSSQYVAWMMTNLIDKMKSMATGGTFKEISSAAFQTLEIPLPPISIQQKIVTEIESYQKIIDGARMVVENYKPRIEIDPEWKMVELGRIIKLSSGQGLTAANMIEGPYPVYGGNGINGYHNECFTDEPTIVIGRVGAYCGSVHITEAKSWITDNGLFVTETLTEINRDFLAQMLIQLEINKYAKVGGQPSISQKTVTDLQIPLPPIKVQEILVTKLLNERSLMRANYELIGIFEQKVKDVINRVWQGKGKKYEVKEEELGMVAE